MTRRLAAILSLDVAGYTEAMSRDEAATREAVAQALRAVVRPAVRENQGRIFKLMGDGALAIFDAAAGALSAAARIQAAMRDAPLDLRAGIHAGDVTLQGEDAFGDAVNIAARLQAAAPPGGAFISRLAADLAGGGHDLAFRAEGPLRLKGAPRPVETLSLALDGPGPARAPEDLAREQRIRFATSEDGTRLAWAETGEGPTLVKAPNWMQHLELDWDNMFAGWLSALAGRRRLVRFDQRGNGLSDHDVAEISFDRFIEDLEAVFDAAGIERAPVLGFSQGASIAVAFAARRPERVSRLVLVGGLCVGVDGLGDAEKARRAEATAALGEADWLGEPPSIRDLLAEMVAPGASAEDRRVYAAQMREMISPENFARFRRAIATIDVTGLLPQVRCPALVLHGRGDRMQPPEQGRRYAAGLSDARFVALPTDNHLPPDYDPAFPVMMREIDAFLDEDDSAGAAA